MVTDEVLAVIEIELLEICRSYMDRPITPAMLAEMQDRLNRYLEALVKANVLSAIPDFEMCQDPNDPTQLIIRGK